MDVTTQIFVNFPLITNIKSHERIFFPFSLLVTSISPLLVEFIIKAMFREKGRLYILVQDVLGNRACTVASDFGYSC